MSAYRDDLAALAARQEALAAEVSDKTRQLEAATLLLEEVRAKARLPILDNIRVASPCTVDWAQMAPMSGDDRVRACGQCQKNVYNLSELTREEAEALILKTHGDLCGRYYQRKDGTILLKDCSVGVARNRKRKVIAVGAAAFLGGFAGLYALTHRHKAEVMTTPCMMDGADVSGPVDVAEPPPPPVETLELPLFPDLETPHVTMGLISAPVEDEALVLERQIAELKLERVELDRRILEAKQARDRLQQGKPRQPHQTRKTPSPGEESGDSEASEASDASDASEPSLEQLLLPGK